jgi:F1F0 ATPase subunit 2
MMNELLLLIPLIPALVTGLILGVFFYGGLWWTVGKGLFSPNAALWFIASLLIRTLATVAGFYFISAGSWQKLLTCLVGFLLTRFVVLRFSPLAKVKSLPLR